MNHFYTNAAISLGLALSATVAIAAMDSSKMVNGKSIYGSVASAGQVSKVVDVGSTNVLNVDCGDIVAFRSGDKSFSWKFDTTSHRAVDLQSIAPSGFINKSLKIYVVPNEWERN